MKAFNLPVFRGYCLIIRRNLTVLLVYFGVYLLINSAMSMQGQESAGSFSAERVDIAVIDRDQSAMSRALTEFLKQDNNVTTALTDRADLARQLYDGGIQYVLQIPEEFGGDLAAGTEKLQETKQSGSAAGYLVDAQIGQFCWLAQALLQSGSTEEEVAQETLDAMRVKPEVTLVRTQTLSDGSRPAYVYTFQYLPYIYLSITIFIIGYVLQSFSGREIRRRMLAAPDSTVSQSLQAVAALGLVFLVFWAASMLLPAAAGSLAFYTSPLRGLYLLNSLAFLLVSLSIGFLTASLVKSRQGLAAMADVVGLGMCFLCGVFVPMRYLGTGVLAAARFLPAYWYETANNLLSDTAVLSRSARAAVRQAIWIELAYALAIFAVTLFLRKKKDQNTDL